MCMQRQTWLIAQPSPTGRRSGTTRRCARTREIGANVIVGRGAYVGTGVQVGDNCKIQNYALVYEPAKLARGVFIGPAVVLTNDHFPRAINADGTPKSARRLASGRRGRSGRAPRSARAHVRRPRHDRALGARRPRVGGDQGRSRLRPRGRQPCPPCRLGRHRPGHPLKRRRHGGLALPGDRRALPTGRATTN